MDKGVKESYGLAGLENSGNSCYLNSTIQVLSHTLPLTRYFLLDKPMGYFMADDFLNKYIMLLDGLWASNMPVKATSFTRALQSAVKQFESLDPNDVQECFTVILDHLQRGIAKFVAGNEKNIITDLFYGEITERFKCLECSHAIKKAAEFCCLILTIPSPAILAVGGIAPRLETQRVTLQDCIDKYFSCETIDYSCEKCKNSGVSSQKAQKTMAFTKLPQILVIYLQRREYLQSKNNTFVDFPIHNYKLQNNDGKVETYHLYATVNHVGNEMNGHYYTFCKNIDRRWYLYNDIKVLSVQSEQHVISPYTCMLFYYRA